MIALMTADGKLVLKPESGIEAFALARWTERVVVEHAGVTRAESRFYRGSAITVDMTGYPETMRAPPRDDPNRPRPMMSQPFTRQAE